MHPAKSLCGKENRKNTRHTPPLKQVCAVRKRTGDIAHRANSPRKPYSKDSGFRTREKRTTHEPPGRGFRGVRVGDEPLGEMVHSNVDHVGGDMIVRGGVASRYFIVSKRRAKIRYVKIFSQNRCVEKKNAPSATKRQKDACAVLCDIERAISHTERHRTLFSVYPPMQRVSGKAQVFRRLALVAGKPFKR
ncbi:MAG: hypothetical protein DELT_01303 [Desulfovibrio sp.]